MRKLDGSVLCVIRVDHDSVVEQIPHVTRFLDIGRDRIRACRSVAQGRYEGQADLRGSLHTARSIQRKTRRLPLADPVNDPGSVGTIRA